MTFRSKRALVALTLAIASATGGSFVKADSTAIYIGGPTGLWNDPTNWNTTPTAGQVPNGTYSVLIDNGNAQNSTVTANGNFSVDSLTIDAGDGLIVADNNAFTINGGPVVNSGSIVVQSVGSDTDLVFNGNVSLSGGGTISLQNVTQVTGSGILTNVDNTIQGFTTQGRSIGENALGIVNQSGGLIVANVAGQTLNLDPSSAAGIVNQGIMRASNGGILSFTGNGGGGLDNSNGTLDATGTGSAVVFVASFAVSGGTFTTSNGGQIETGVNQAAFLANLTNAGTYVMEDNSTTHISGTITNSGTFAFNSLGDPISLNVDGNTTLTGGGTVTISSVSGIGGSGILTNVNNTIQGFTTNGLNFGENTVGIVNESGGLIVANVMGQTLTIDPDSADGIVNQGVMEASNGGTLVLTGNGGGGLINTGATLNATGAGSVIEFINNFSVMGGTLASDTGGQFETGVSQTVFLSNVTNAGTYVMEDNSTTHISGTITNSGTFSFNSLGDGVFLTLDSNITLMGGGTVTLSSNSQITGTNSFILTNVNNTLQGFGNLGANQIGIINQSGGLIVANVSGQTLTVDPDITDGIVNQGVMRASNGGILLFTGNAGGGLINTGATLNATGAGSVIEFINNFSVTGGTLASDTGGQFETGVSQTVFLSNVTNTGTYVMEDNSTTHISGTFTNNGNLAFNSVGDGVNLVLDGDVLLNGGGTVSLLGPSAITGSGNLTNVDNTIQGFTTSSLGANAIGIINEAGGSIIANVATKSIFIDPSPTGMINLGTVGAINGGTIIFTGNAGGGLDNTGGTIKASGAGSVVEFTNGFTTTNALLVGDTGGEFQTVTNQTVTFANFTLQGNYVAEDNSTTIIAGAFVNQGVFTLASLGSNTILSLGADATLTGGGIINLQNVASISGTGTLTNVDNTIQGFTTSSLGGNSLAILNEAGGSIIANVATKSISIDPSPAGMINLGTVEAINGGTIVFTGNAGGGLDNTGGTIKASGAGSVVEFTTGFATTNASLVGDTGGEFQTLPNQTVTFANFTLQGNYVAEDNSTTIITGAFVNQGVFTLASLGSNTILSLGANATLTGGGIINLQNTASISGTGTLTNVDNTIQGFTTNSLGGNAIGIINQSNGSIIANTATKSINIDPSQADGMINMGLVEAINGGIIVFTGNAGGGLDNTGGTIKASGAGSLVEFTNTFATTNALLVGDTGGEFQTLPNQTVTFANFTLQGNYVAEDNSTTIITGAFVNQGVFTLASLGSNTILSLGANATLTGGGIINLQNVASISGTGTLTNVDNTIQGFTTSSLGADSLAIVNEAGGSIIANVATKAIIIDPSPTGGMINMGLVEAINGGIIIFTGNDGGGLDNTGGTIKASGAGSLVEFTNNFATTNALLVGDTGGEFQTLPNQTVTFANFTLQGNYVAEDNSTTIITGAFVNQGVFTLASVGSSTILSLGADVTLTGGGIINLQSAALFSGTGNLTNVDNTIQGFTTQSIGSNAIGIDNQANGSIIANTSGQTLRLDPNPTVGMTNEGLLSAVNGGTLLLTGNALGSFTNTGTMQALDGSSVVMDASAVLTNNVAGVLTLGTYRAVSTGDGATITLQGAPITIIAANTTVELNGVGAIIQVGTTGIDSSLTENDGTLKVLSGLSFVSTHDFINNGQLQLGGGIFTETSLTNNANATIMGFGSLTNRPLNHGTIESVGGTLTLADGINGGSGTIESTLGSTLDLSGGSSGSNGDFLINNGNLVIGANNVTVAISYTNANFGVGDTFDKHANVSTTTGKILASGNSAEQVSTTAIDFHNVHVGDVNSQTYTVTNSGTTGPSVLFAIQPHANGGNIDDLGLTGSGVTSQNVGPLASGASSDPLTITYTATHGGPLTGQVVHIANNFDNISETNITVSGVAYFFASPLVSNATISFPNSHVGDSVSGNVGVLNNAPTGNFTEKLDATLSNGSGNVTYSPSLSLIPAGTTQGITATLDTSTPGHITGSSNLNLVSDGTGTSGLPNTNLGNVTLNASGDVYRLANASVATPNPINFGNHHQGDSVAPIAYSVTNNVPNDGFSEKLDASLSNLTNAGVAISGNISLLAPGQAASTLLATLDTTTAGAKGGSATANFVSNGTNTSNLAATSLGNQTLNATGAVYRLASPGPVTSTVYNVGTVHVGDNVTENPTFSNSAPADGFSETLIVNISSNTANGFTTTGSSSGGVLPGSSNGGFVTVGLDTSTAQIGRSGSVSFHYQSDGNGTFGGINDGLGLTDLPTADDATVTINANVLNYAVASLFSGSGGSLTETDATHYTLDLGTIAPGGTATGGFDIANTANGPADTLSGDFTNNAPDFSFTNLASFAGLIAGGSPYAVDVSFTSSTLGVQTETITLDPSSVDDAPFVGALAPITITLTADVEPSTVPEPASLTVLGFGAAALLTRRRRSSK